MQAMTMGMMVLLVRREEAQQIPEPLVGTKRIEKLAYILLKEDDERQHTHAHQLVHDTAEQAHL